MDYGSSSRIEALDPKAEVLEGLPGQEQQLEPDMDNRLVPDWERSTSRLYIVTLLV